MINYQLTYELGTQSSDITFDTMGATIFTFSANERGQSFTANSTGYLRLTVPAMVAMSRPPFDYEFRVYSGEGFGGTEEYITTGTVNPSLMFNDLFFNTGLLVTEGNKYTWSFKRTGGLEMSLYRTILNNYPDGSYDGSGVSDDLVFTGEIIQGPATVSKLVKMSPEGDLKVEQQRESGQVFFRKKLNSKLRVYKKDEPDAYRALKKIADSVKCREAEIRISCNGHEEFRGRIRRKNVKVNLTKCYVTLSPETLDEYTCILDNWERTSNVFFEQEVTAYADPNLQYEEVSATAVATTAHNPSILYAAITTAMITAPESSTTPTADEKYYQQGITGTELDKPVEWCLLDNSVSIQEGDPEDTLTVISRWGRELYSVPTGGTPVGDGWTLHAGLTTGGTDVYWRCPRAECQISDLTHGRMLEDVCNKVIEDMGCSVSESESILLNFGSPNYSEPTNKEYAAKDEYQYVTFHQKSDVIYPLASSPSRQISWYITFKELTEMLSIYQLRWDVYKGKIRFEHLSYYEQLLGGSLTTNKEVSYESEALEVPAVESFEWADVCSDYFLGSEIRYPNCTSKDAENFSFGNITTDICFLNANTEADPEGFVLVANDSDGTDLFIIDGNVPHSFTELHTNFWRYARPLPSGIMNEVETSFDEPVRFKKATFTKKFCCGESIETNVLRSTPVGKGELSKSSLDLITRIAELELMH